jgi:hypothetical protein
VVKYYESVLAAKDVHIDAIPLPNMSMSGENEIILLILQYYQHMQILIQFLRYAAGSCHLSEKDSNWSK